MDRKDRGRGRDGDDGQRGEHGTARRRAGEESCAKKHFCAIGGDDVRYDAVDSYEPLRQLVMSV
ncbi:MAG: hypothetical protein MR665_04690 [Selenomonas bovis]|nr:hypothetical protein [Selenomonas bovis]MCI7056762.1 hypothetical protein [Selenomonas bovis]